MERAILIPMATATKTDINGLRREVKLLRSFVIGLAGRDPEGAYRPEFVREIVRAAREKPRFRFKNAKSFLTHLRRTGSA